MNKEAYKLKSAEAINAYTREERLTKCGYADFHWSQGGVVASSLQKGRDNFIHPRQQTFRSDIKQELSQEECNLLREDYLPSMQKTSLLEDLYSTEEE